MRTWEQLQYNDTFKELVDKFNINSNNSKFIDDMTGTILSNGVLYQGNETVDGKLIRPLEKVDVSGVVQSNTILDNFVLYFRDTNKLVSLDLFPIDLLSYANGKPQFLYIKEDLTYRISDYMFGHADEILLARFVINTNSTWNQLFIIAQRAGTPMYNAADEFYEVDGMYVKSPGGLELSQTSGTVKRSGIDFTDKVSPDIAQFYNLASERVPLRYINVNNEIDYTQAVTYNVQTDKYMIYNMNKKLKVEAEDYIRLIQNLYYGIREYSNNVANELHDSIVAGGTLEDLQQIVNAYTSYIDIIYNEVDKLYNLLGDSTLSSVRRAVLADNKRLTYNYINLYLTGAAIATEITDNQVIAIRNVPAYILNINLTICPTPLDNALQSVQDDLDGISYPAGQIQSVPAGKFTIQRILWDVYEKVLICQYGDRIYNSFNEAVEGTGLMEFPAPFGKTIYIPLAIMIIKSGTTSINDDSESIIIDRRWIVVDQEQSAYADYVARAKADKALNQIQQILDGTLVVEKTKTLYSSVGYKDGDYYLNYDNLNNKVTVINNVTSSSYNAKQALSAYQGYILKTNWIDKIIDGTDNAKVPAKAKTLYSTGKGSYQDGDYYLNYNNFTNKPTIPIVINNLTSDDTSNALSAKQGKVLNENFASYLPLSGGTMTGAINSQNILPKTTNIYALGSSSNRWNSGYIKSLYQDTNKPYIYSNDNSTKNIQAMAKTSADDQTTWNNIPKNTIVVCWT